MPTERVPNNAAMVYGVFYVFVHHQGLTTRNPLIVETEQRLARVEEDNTGQIVAEMEEVDWNWHNILVPSLAEQQKKPNKAEPAYFKVLNHLGKEERISAYPVSLGKPASDRLYRA